MQTIHILDEAIVAKIAAGEVIERPAYALKELIDNAIDAKADEIVIQLEEGGLKKIQVIDNGIGMSKEDIRICIKPHATSKIVSESDLYSIKTLGYRGEALWSIAAVSHLTIKSRTRDSEIGNELVIDHGEIDAFNVIAMPYGTDVEINNIFKNIPARLKFLRKKTTEYKNSIEILIGYILAYPSINITCAHDGKTVFAFSDKQDKAQRAAILFGKEIYENLIPIQKEIEYIKISGFVTKPQVAVSTPMKQYLFVNNRKISDKIISATIKQAYGTLLEPKVSPAYMVFIDVPPERIDVNIHPRKEQIAFAETSKITKIIYETVVETLGQKNIAFHDYRWQRGDYIRNVPIPISLREGGTNTYAGKLIKEITDIWTPLETKTTQPSESIIQIHNTFIIQQIEQGIRIIDQHAAHERILYEQFLQTFNNEKTKKELYHLPKPYILTLGVQGALIIEQHKEELQKIGIDIEEFKDHQYVIKTIPIIYKGKNLDQLILEVINDLESKPDSDTPDTQSHKMLSYLACRSAIKAGEKLTKEQAKNLIKKLDASNIKYTCPHGRPAQVEISLKEIYRLFHRTQSK